MSPSHHAYDAETGVYKITHAGLITRDGLLTVFEKMRADPNYDAASRFLVDARTARTRLSMTDLLTLARQKPPRREDSRTAVVVRPGVLAGLNHRLTALLGSVPLIRTFYDFKEAVAWLMMV